MAQFFALSRSLLDAPSAAGPAALNGSVESGKHHAGTISTAALAIIVVLASLAAVSLLAALIYHRLSRRKDAAEVFTQQSEKSATECMLPIAVNSSASSTPSATTPRLQYSPQKEPQVFSYKQLRDATNDFSQQNVIGSGGFGSVYRGTLANGRVAAIKQLECGGKQGEEEFRVEIDLLSRVHSPYLLELLGYCTDDEHRLLVYEYMSNGNLQQQLYPDENSGHFAQLGWTTRMKIALEAAKGLEYLHEVINPPIIHRDFKCSNILLDDKLNAKLSDFGIAKIGSNKINGDVSTRVLGTHGYVAPEYVLTGHLTTKSDVYSFGVVLLEILTGRVPVDMKRPPGQGVLVSWALPRLTDRDKLVEMVDPALKGQYSMKELIQVAAIAAMCVQPEADYRPLMIDVVQSLTPLVVKQKFQASRNHHVIDMKSSSCNGMAVNPS